MYEYSVQLERIVDGDTLYLRVDLGFEISTVQNFRLAGLNAPERFTDEGKKATAWLTERLNAIEQDHLVVQTIKDKKEKYGRYLVILYDHDPEIEISSDVKSINTEMIERGFAVPYMVGV